LSKKLSSVGGASFNHRVKVPKSANEEREKGRGAHKEGGAGFSKGWEGFC